MLKRTLVLLLLIASLAGIGRGWYRLRDGFSVARLHGWTQTSLCYTTPDVETILQQKFHYLGRGRQSFAFASEDGKYVIKLPRADHFRLPLWLRALNVPCTARLSEKRRRESFLLNSFRLSAEELGGITPTIAMKLSTQAFKGKALNIVDRLGQPSTIPLENTYFVLQHRKRLFRDVFQKAVLREGSIGAEKVLDALLALLVERANKGILNKDGSFLRNFGYDDLRAYQIDVGSFYRNERLSQNEAYIKSIAKSAAPIRTWLKEQNPAWAAMFDQKLAAIYTQMNSKVGRCQGGARHLNQAEPALKQLNLKSLAMQADSKAVAVRRRQRPTFEFIWVYTQ